FSSVGLIGRVGGPKRWMEPINPLTAKQEIKFKIPDSTDGNDVVISLVATDVGDGNKSDFVVWQAPRLVSPGRPDLLLRDVREVARGLAARREQLFANAAAYLAAADEIAGWDQSIDVAKTANERDSDTVDLRAWLDYLGIGSGTSAEITGLFT